MNVFENIRQVYFLGIGGIGMSALARYFNHVGYKVSGYDRTLSALTRELEKEGIAVHDDDRGEKIKIFVGTQNDTLVVFTPAVPEDHGELTWLRFNGYPLLKRSKVLGMICNQKKCLAVAGTHGKTTISTMAAVILKFSESGCGAFLGGISKNFGSNLLLPNPQDEWLVTEADEFDRSFLQLTPDVAVITYMDPDHLDIYSNQENLKMSFFKFASQVRSGGCLIVNRDLVQEFSLLPDRKICTYSLAGEADFHALDLQVNPGTMCYSFRLKTPGGTTPVIEMVYPGILNVENAVAAGAAAFMAGATLTEIKNGLEKYIGVKRRFDIRFRSERTLYIDDYGHHPNELKAFISAVKLLFPDKKVTGIFQPHLYTRTRDFAAEFAKSLDLLDMALLLPIYPAREEPIPGVDSALIMKYMTSENKKQIEKNEVSEYIRQNRPEVLLTMGAGDIELLADKIISALKDENIV